MPDQPSLLFAPTVLTLVLASQIAGQQSNLWELIDFGVEPNGAPAALPVQTAVDPFLQRILRVDSDGQLWRWAEPWVREDVPGARPSGLTTRFDITFDTVRHVLVLYDGLSGATWELGTSWVQRTTSSPISERRDFALGFDRTSGKTVLHGGIQSPGFLTMAFNDTWEWDGEAWTLVDSAGPARADHDIEFDPVSGGMMLFGGFAVIIDPQPQNTWLRSGSGWSLTPAPQLPGSNGSLAIDESQGQVLCGTRQFLSGPMVLRRWDGSSWLPIPAASDPAASAAELAFDPETGEPVAFSLGGEGFNFDGSTWRSTPSRVPLNFETGLAYDSARDRLVTLTNDFGNRHKTWELSGDTWASVETPNRPQRETHELAFDTARARTVLFGGMDLVSGALTAETWEWDGSQWLLADPGTGPSARSEHAVAYDEARGVLVVFGGFDSSGTRLNDTWTWDGSTWTVTATAPQNAPSPRARHAMAYDAIRQRVVLFGGSTSQALSDEVWEWDGADWAPVSVATGPSGREGHAMAYDNGLQRIIMHGGGLGPDAEASTWEWNGTRWLDLGGDDLRGRDHAMVFVGGQNQRVIGVLSTGNRPDLYQLRIDELETRCANTPGGMHLSLSQPRPAPGDIQQTTLSNVPMSGTLFNLLGFDTFAPAVPLDALGITNCSLVPNDPIVTSVLNLQLFAADGIVRQPFAIPNSPSTLGVRVVMQSVASDPSTNLLSLSNGAIFVVTERPDLLIVTEVSPPAAQAGSPVEILGTGFDNTTEITLAGVAVPTTLIDGSRIAFQYPPALGCDAVLKITRRTDLHVASVAVNVTPVIESVEPSSGTATGGNLVRVGGGPFVPGITVSVAGTLVSPVVTTESLLAFFMPPGTPGSVPIVITSPSGCSTTFDYTYL